MIKKMMFFMVSGLVLMFTSCGDQHKAQSLLNEVFIKKILDQRLSLVLTATRGEHQHKS